MVQLVNASMDSALVLAGVLSAITIGIGKAKAEETIAEKEVVETIEI